MKNSIKTPNNDTIKGTGYNKLDSWSINPSLVSNRKKLESTFNTTTNTKLHIFRNEIICEKCGKKFLVNNTNKIPNHKNRTIWFRKKEICEGSWSKQLSEHKDVIELNEINSYIGLLKLGDKLLIDCDRNAIKEELNGKKFNDILLDKINIPSEIIEVTIVKILKTTYYLNDGTVANRYNEQLLFDNINEPISTFLTRFMCKSF